MAALIGKLVPATEHRDTLSEGAVYAATVASA